MSNPSDDSAYSPDKETTASSSEAHNKKEVFGLTLDIGYIKSIHGMLRAGEIFLTLVAFICVSSSRNEACDFLHAATYNFFEFTSMTAFLSTLIIYVIFILEVHNKIFFRFVPWLLADALWCVVFALMFFLASCVLAAHVCHQGGNQAGAAFGFFSCAAIGADGVLSGLQFRAERMSTTHHSAPSTLPGQTLEQY
ncbi:hypothetical protein SNE40_008442 [Patella caerulea]|uniref:MARVEL domain-containing protein n=1 Tax=Patella caerulea TaxID=87958 RepID=A0AAN8Q3P7_PATCE